LTAVNERPLPFHDTTAAFVSPNATWSIVRGTVRVTDRSALVELTRHEHFLDNWPCDALVAMRADFAKGKTRGSGGLRAYAPRQPSDTSCDRLREEPDTSRLSVRHAAEGVDVLVSRMKQDFAKWPFPDGGSVVGDTVRMTRWTVRGDVDKTGKHERAQELRLLFVKAQPAR
jgi:hypothetical protein